MVASTTMCLLAMKLSKCRCKSELEASQEPDITHKKGEPVPTTCMLKEVTNHDHQRAQSYHVVTEIVYCKLICMAIIILSLIINLY